MNDDAYPALNHLAGCYLHQDFRQVSGDALAAVEEFLTLEPKIAATVVSEISRALDAHPSEADIRQFVQDDLDSAYLVEHDGLTYRGWLQSVADRARKLGY